MARFFRSQWQFEFFVASWFCSNLAAALCCLFGAYNWRRFKKSSELEFTRSTVFVPPLSLSTLPDISDFKSNGSAVSYHHRSLMALIPCIEQFDDGFRRSFQDGKTAVQWGLVHFLLSRFPAALLWTKTSLVTT